MSTRLKSGPLLLFQTLSLAGLCLLPTQSRAISERLDDTASPRNRVVSQTVLGDQGQLLAHTASGTLVTLKFGRINYKLATAKFIGKRARIYYVVPLAITGLRSPVGLKVEWRGHGIFSNGRARPGERSMVWAGTVHEAWMTEGLDVTMQVDLREINLPPGANFGFESYFEIETLP
jgi:hypothetical protein